MTPAHLPTLPSAHRGTTPIRLVILPCPPCPALDRVDTAQDPPESQSPVPAGPAGTLPAPGSWRGVCGYSTDPLPKVRRSKVVSATRTNALTHQRQAEQPSRLSLNPMVPPRDHTEGGERFRRERGGKSSRKERCMRRAQLALRNEESKGAGEREWKGTVFPLTPPPSPGRGSCSLTSPAAGGGKGQSS